MKNKTIPAFTKVLNGVTVPIGYETLSEYLDVLKLNLKIAKKNPKRYGYLIPRYEADIATVESRI